MNHYLYLIFTILFVSSFSSHAGKQEAISLLKAGQYKEAIVELKALAEAGDTVAMVTIGELYYEGKGVEQDYSKTMDWWLRAADKNGDAFSNIGVLYRDGKGVPKNLEVAYAIFVITHMRGLGGQNTQVRNGRNLGKAINQMSQHQIESALCLSEQYVATYVLQRGRVSSQAASMGVPIKDREWWIEGELPEIECGSSQ